MVALMDAPACAPGSRVYVNELAGMSASVAMAVNISRLPSFTVLSLMGAKTGALFTSLTMIVKLLVSLNGGVPSSVTRTVMMLVLGPCASLGVQVSTPVAESSVIPLGPATRRNVRVFAGISGSVAELVTIKVVSSLIVCVDGTVSIGALFTSLTMTVKLLVSLNGGLPLSVTRTVMTLVLGPCASVGVQFRTPMAESSVIPLGTATKENVSVLAGISESVAELVTVMVVNSLIV